MMRERERTSIARRKVRPPLRRNCLECAFLRAPSLPDLYLSGKAPPFRAQYCGAAISHHGAERTRIKCRAARRPP